MEDSMNTPAESVAAPVMETIIPGSGFSESGQSPVAEASLLTNENDDSFADVENDAVAQDAEAAVPPSPDAYEFQFGEETQVNEELLSTFRGLAHAEKFTLQQAQAVAALFEQHVQGENERGLERQKAAVQEAERNWIQELRRDPQFTTTVAQAKVAMKTFNTPELDEFLTTTKLGSHPEMVRLFARIGQKLSEPAFRGSGAGGNDFIATHYPESAKHWR